MSRGWRVRAADASMGPREQVLALPLRLARPLTWPFPVQLTVLGVAIALAMPALARLYAGWWDLIWGAGSFCRNFMPLP